VPKVNDCLGSCSEDPQSQDAGPAVPHWGGDFTLTFRNDSKVDQGFRHVASVNLDMTRN
jgi:hypothetical protein